jgi:Methyltransferase domain
MTTPVGIDYFNRAHPLHVVKVRLALRARRRMYDRLLTLVSLCRNSRVLDVGVTPDMEIPYNNFFERWYPHPDRVTACSIEDCSNLEAHFPGLTVRQIEGGSLPFRDNEFDLAVCFAVLEHVGARSEQRQLLSELSRVAHEFVAYTPYRYFPIEMHTFFPVVHWLPGRIYRALWRRLGLTFWADERNLNLLSLTAVKELLPSIGSTRLRLLWTCGWPSNIEIHWRRETGPDKSPRVIHSNDARASNVAAETEGARPRQRRQAGHPARRIEIRSWRSV